MENTGKCLKNVYKTHRQLVAQILVLKYSVILFKCRLSKIDITNVIL